MSGQVKDRANAQPADKRSTKAERREARIAAAKAARRRKLLAATGGTFLGVVLLIGLAFLVFRDNGTDQSTASTPNASATAPAEDPNAAPTADPNTPANAEFPPLPAGADPALKTKPQVTKGSGDLKELKVTPLVEGKGPAVKSGDTVTVNYVGVKYATGEEFDSSWSRSQAYPTQIGVGAVIPGWDQGLVGVKVGSRVQLDIPASLAYGDGPDSRLPGPLRFVVDVLGVSAS
ncbi:FKBP-type peptidyl-prolyl cis-trans isomerase [Catellatospora sp. NPDC049609]|uniref:FKBP-type peptidyl-prolyl cis-trans isomerase n=1 Tax=Catellatospora sp. NPDC049609 TaxID=3155505 RepID=UPI003445E010